MRRALGIAAPAGLAAALLTAIPVSAAPPGEAPFAPVVQQVLRGDLVMAANSNLGSAGGWRLIAHPVADVDGDTTSLCLGRTLVPAACADNSSSATLDVPAGARIVAARLYVDTSLTTLVDPIRVRLDGPATGYDYTELAADTPGIPKVGESAGASTPVRQAVWDVTDYVTTNGPGSYTVADIPNERGGAFLPYASWAVVAAYELAPGADLSTMTPAQQARFAPRAITWHDGFVLTSNGSLDVPVSGFEVSPVAPVFAKELHVVAHAQQRGVENVLFAGQPLGNNVSPGDAPPPTGVTVGSDPACNSTTNIFDDSICDLGTAVTTKSPGADAYVASGDGRTVTSGSGVDMDITRIPDRYFVPGTTTATLSVQVHGFTPLATGMLAVSVDLPSGAAGATP